MELVAKLPRLASVYARAGLWVLEWTKLLEAGRFKLWKRASRRRNVLRAYPAATVWALSDVSFFEREERASDSESRSAISAATLQRVRAMISRSDLVL